MLFTVIKMVVSQEGWFLMLTFHCVLNRELLLNNNQLRVLPFELGKLFQLQTLGLKGEWLINVFCSHSSLEIPLFSLQWFSQLCFSFTRKPTCTRNYEPLPGTWWHAKTAQLLVRQSGWGYQTQWVPLLSGSCASNFVEVIVWHVPPCRTHLK